MKRTALQTPAPDQMLEQHAEEASPVPSLPIQMAPLRHIDCMRWHPTPKSDTLNIGSLHHPLLCAAYQRYTAHQVVESLVGCSGGVRRAVLQTWVSYRFLVAGSVALAVEF